MSSQARATAALECFFRFLVEEERLLRHGEMIGLDRDDVDLSRRLLRIRKAKGGRQRMIPIHPVLAPLFADTMRRGCR